MATAGKRILVVEDDVQFRRLVTTFFEGEGWTVRGAMDGHQAVINAKEFLPDIILMDVKIPFRDGVTVCRILKNDITINKVFPIIMMTAYADKNIIIKSIDAGCDDFLVKPFKFDLCLEKAAKLVDFYRMKIKKVVGTPEEVNDQEEKIVVYSRQVVQKVFSNAMHGKFIDYPVVTKVINTMVEVLHSRKTLPMAFKMKSYNDYTYIHSVNVASLCMSFALHLSWSDEDIQTLGEGAFLHDVGKTNVDLKVLLKPDKLSETEYTEIKEHPNHGEAILKRQKISSDVIKVVTEHHERMDGTGYPRQLTGDQISEFGRLCSIVDVYDAMTTDRCYHKGVNSHIAIEGMLNDNKKSIVFDPEYLRQFASLVLKGSIGK